jgi:hypothetical protein
VGEDDLLGEGERPAQTAAYDLEILLHAGIGAADEFG